jgi:hypothetical protein
MRCCCIMTRLEVHRIGGLTIKTMTQMAHLPRSVDGRAWQPAGNVRSPNSPKGRMANARKNSKGGLILCTSVPGSPHVRGKRLCVRSPQEPLERSDNHKQSPEQDQAHEIVPEPQKPSSSCGPRGVVPSGASPFGWGPETEPPTTWGVEGPITPLVSRPKGGERVRVSLLLNSTSGPLPGGSSRPPEHKVYAVGRGFKGGRSMGENFRQLARAVIAS